MTRIVERLSDHPAMVVSRCGEVLSQSGLELYRRLLLDPVDYQLLLVYTAVPGSPSDEKPRRPAAASD